MYGWVILIAVIWFLADTIKSDAKLKKTSTQMRQQGGFLSVDYKRDSIICQDLRMDWLGDKVNFPIEYRAYFEKNRDALTTYIRGLANQKAIAEGNAPICVGSYNRFTYDAFAGFHSLYDDKIKILNETGVYYY